MSNLSVIRSPQLIAAEINNIKSQTRKMLLYNSIEIGRRLTEAKSLVDHGEWGTWLEKSVEYSKSTSNNLMRIFDEYAADQITLLDDNAKSDTFAKLSYSQAVALLGVPEEEREAFIENNDIDNMSTRELQQAIKERDQALENLANVRHIAIEKSEEARKFYDEKCQVEADRRTTDQVLRTTQADVKMLQDTLKKERDNSKKSINDLEDKIIEAKASGNTEEVEQLQESIGKIESELENSNLKIIELERQLLIKPIEASYEKIPEEIEKELEELRKKANPSGIKFKLIFDDLVKKFQELLVLINEMDSETQEKYKKAVEALANKILEKLGESNESI